MKNLFALAAVMIIALAGCAPEKEKKGGGKPADPPRQAEGDPRAATAKHVSGELLKHRGAVDAEIDKVNKAVAAARREGRFDDVKAVEALRKEAARAVQAINALNEELQVLDRELRHAQSAFSAASQAFKDRSEDYSDKSLRETCLGWSTHYEAQAAAAPAERERIRQFTYGLPATLNLCRETKRLLDDYALFLATYHDAAVPTRELEGYKQTLRDYVQKFSEFERAVSAYKGAKPGDGA